MFRRPILPKSCRFRYQQSDYNFTALTGGIAGDFALSVQNAGSSGFTGATTVSGAGPNYITAIAAPATGGSGYTGGSGCTITGGGGSGATCALQLVTTTAGAAYQPAFGATPGWDFATGLGSVNAYNLVMNTAW